MLNRLEWLYKETLKHNKEHPCCTKPYKNGFDLIEIIKQNNIKKILELGTGIGYTAALMASINTKIHIDTLERNRTHVYLSMDNFKKLGLEKQIVIIPGLFENSLYYIIEKYDLIFFDGFKPKKDILKRLKILLNKNGVIFLANIHLLIKIELEEIIKIFPVEYWKISFKENNKTIIFTNVSCET